MNALLYRLRSSDGTTDVRTGWLPDVGPLMVKFYLANKDNPHAWAAVDLLYPDGTTEENDVQWNREKGILENEREADGLLYRTRTGGARGLHFSSSWETWRKARSKWEQAMNNYADSPPAWAVLDTKTSDGTIVTGRIWQASEEAKPVLLTAESRINRKK